MTSSNAELISLLERSSARDQQAFAELYRRCSARLFGICLQLLRNSEEAEDALQETFLRIWHGAGDYHADRGSPLNWMITIARYRCLDHLRSPHARSGTEDLPEDLEDGMPGPFDRSRQSMEAAQLEDCIGRLDESQRDSILMAYFHGLSHGQLAKNLKIPLGTVKSWIRRGMMDLRRCLEA